MSKIVKTILVLVFATVFIYACKDDEVPTFSTEDPLDGYLTAANFTEAQNIMNSGDYEFGITFIPLVKGNFTGIKVKLPNDRTDLRVTLWDATGKTVLRTETIATVTADTEFSMNITPISLIKGTEYMITFNSNDWYYRTQTGGGDATYPITVGNISITGYGWVGGSDQTYPINFETNYYAGDLSFGFQQTN